MQTIKYQDNWQKSWKESYTYDLMEIYGDRSCPGYVYTYANRKKHILELIQKVAQPGDKILDVAAAQGNFTLSLAELGYEVTWNDLREDLVDYVKLKWEHGSIHYAPGNVFSLGFESEFDVVLVAEIIEHVAHPDQFLQKIARMVKPKGYIVLTTPNGEYFQNRLPKFSDCADPSKFEAIQFKPNSDGHIFLLYLDEIEVLANKANLSIMENRLFSNTITNGYLKSRIILPVMPIKLVNIGENLTQSLPLYWQKKIHTSMAVLLTIS